MKLFCTNTRDVSNLIDKLFVDIIKRKDLSNFKIAKEIEKGKEAKADAIILEPNGGGEGLDYTEMLSFLKRDEIIENLKNKLSCLTDPTRLAIENGIDEFYRRNYINCVRILFPSIEEITNQMLQAENINPTSFSGLADKLTRLKELGKVDDDLVQSIKISTARNAVLHGNYNPNKQELVRPLCYSSMTFLTELIK